MARQPGEVAAVEFPLDALLQSPHHIPLGIGGGVAENPHVAAPAEVLAVDEVRSDDPLDLIVLIGAEPGGNQAERESAEHDEIERIVAPDLIHSRSEEHTSELQSHSD